MCVPRILRHAASCCGAVTAADWYAAIPAILPHHRVAFTIDIVAWARCLAAFHDIVVAAVLDFAFWPAGTWAFAFTSAGDGGRAAWYSRVYFSSGRIFAAALPTCCLLPCAARRQQHACSSRRVFSTQTTAATRTFLDGRTGRFVDA